MGNKERLVIVTFMVAMMLLAPIAGIVGADETTETTSDIPSDEIMDEITVWDRAAISFQADTDDANVSIDLPRLFVETPDAEGGLDRHSVGVYKANDPVTFAFGESDDANAGEFGDDVTVIRGYLSEGDAPFNESLETINENVVFEESAETYDLSNDTFEHEDTPTNPGQYVYLVANDIAVDNTDGNITNVENATIYGIEQIVVHENPSTVEAPSSAEPGDNIEFDASATALDGDVAHDVVLYHEEDFKGSKLTINATEGVDNLSAENLTITSDIESLNGEVEFDEVVEFVAGTAGLVKPTTETGDVQLNASANSTVGDANEKLILETDENWTEGDYRWIHVATGNYSDEIQVMTGTVSLEASTGGGGGFVPAPSPEPEPNPEPTAVISIDPNPAESGEEITFSGADSYDDERDIVSYEWTIDGESYSGETVTTSFDTGGTYDVELTVKNDLGEEDTATATLTVKADYGDGGTGGDGDDGTDGTDGDDGTDGTDGDDGGDEDDGLLPVPGFGINVAIAALLSVALLALRRQ